MDKALKLAARMFTNTQRKGPKVVILITSGKQTRESETVSLVEAMHPLSKFDPKVFVVAVARAPSFRKLEPVLNRVHNLVFAPSYANLKERSDPIARYIRINSGKIVFSKLSSSKN